MLNSSAEQMKKDGVEMRDLLTLVFAHALASRESRAPPNTIVEKATELADAYLAEPTK